MSRLIVIEFVTLDGVIEDPDGSGATAGGGWAFRHGPEAVAGDKFELGSLLDTGVMLLGRRTWELFAKIWPGREGEFAAKMNAIPKLVASRSLTGVDGWENSSLLEGDLGTAVRGRKAEQDVIVTGSVSVVHALADEGLVDEYRLMVFPTVLGAGQQLFAKPAELRLDSVTQKGAAALLRYRVS
ncbi:riboflavin biosynthesis protein RibD [Amycolatopsis acidicola]|uniref:Riboflavin biosynthesis protein RibD n=1 Tax=Amycolatopsis acidicola TaxID=2596893 RepID=A0A5N0UXP5_9PSEU|nr:dihydrofolate reductase family protein [Amycolatopsis acidicola]KAA9155937.1 riboflavin biosynthesis protein RibD [Amycolatopsis acidicola]